MLMGLGRYLEQIPIAALAGILAKLGWDLIGWRLLSRLHRIGPEHYIVMLMTLILTVFVDLLTGVAVGLIAAGMAHALQLERLELDSVISVPLLDRTFLEELESGAKAIREAPKRLAFDEFHRTAGAPAVRAQVERDVREARKLRVRLALASQRLEDFGGALTELANRYWILGAGGKAREIEALSGIFALSETLRDAIRYLLPALPFIRFLFAMLGWIVSVAVAVLAVTVFAAAHVTRGDGDRLATPATRLGWLFLPGLILRPPLMLFGLIAGYFVFLAGIGLFNEVWLPQMRDAGASGGLGPIGFLAMLALYVTIAYGLMNASFKLIDLLPSAVLDWIGGRGGAGDDGAGERVGGVAAGAISRIGGLRIGAGPRRGGGIGGSR